MGKSLNELMGWAGPMTHRQFEAWQAWLGEEWGRPSRNDFYLMQVAAVAAGVKTIDWKKWTIPFKERDERRSRQSERERVAEQAAWAKASLAARRGKMRELGKTLKQQGV